MNRFPNHALPQLIARFGESVTFDPRRCRAFLTDVCADRFRGEVSVLVGAVEEGVPRALLSRSTEVPIEIFFDRLSRRLRENRGISPDLALWAVEHWALALGIVNEVRALAASRLDSMRPIIDMAGADGVISFAEFEHLIHEAHTRGIDDNAARNFVTQYALQRGWQLSGSGSTSTGNGPIHDHSTGLLEDGTTEPTNDARDNSAEYIEQRFRASPKPIQDAITSTETEAFLGALATAYNIDMSRLENEVLFALLGMEPIDELEHNIAKHVDVAPHIAQQIAHRIVATLFVPLRARLEAAETPARSNTQTSFGRVSPEMNVCFELLDKSRDEVVDVLGLPDDADQHILRYRTRGFAVYLEYGRDQVDRISFYYQNAGWQDYQSNVIVGLKPGMSLAEVESNLGRPEREYTNYGKWFTVYGRLLAPRYEVRITYDTEFKSDSSIAERIAICLQT